MSGCFGKPRGLHSLVLFKFYAYYAYTRFMNVSRLKLALHTSQWTNMIFGIMKTNLHAKAELLLGGHEEVIIRVGQ